MQQYAQGLAQPGFNASPSAPPPPASIMEGVIGASDRHNETLEAVVSRLHALRDRLFGTSAGAGSGSGSTAKAGFVYVLNARFERMDSLLADLTGITSDLERMA